MKLFARKNPYRGLPDLGQIRAFYGVFQKVKSEIGARYGLIFNVSENRTGLASIQITGDIPRDTAATGLDSFVSHAAGGSCTGAPPYPLFIECGTLPEYFQFQR